MKTKMILISNLLFTIIIAGSAFGQNLPKPQIKYLGKEDVKTAAGQPATSYRLSVVNRAAYPKEFFMPAPDLPPCGKNPAAWRATVNIYDKQTDKYLYGYCGHPDKVDRMRSRIMTASRP